MAHELVDALRALPPAIFEGVTLSVLQGFTVFYAVSMLLVMMRLFTRRRR